MQQDNMNHTDYFPDAEPKTLVGLCTDGHIRRFQYVYTWIINGRKVHQYHDPVCKTTLGADYFSNDDNYNANTLVAMAKLAFQDMELGDYTLKKNLDNILDKNQL